jgi:hypothetical protein
MISLIVHTKTPNKMSFEQRFTEEEQVLLSSLPTLIGSVMSFASGSGLGTIKELMSSARTVMAGATEFPSNEIITGVVPSQSNLDEGMARARELRVKLQEQLKAHEVDSREELRAYVIETCKKVSEVLAAKASPGEAEAYKTWTLNIAENVARAASEGGFLGIGGTEVSEGEKKLFADLSEALQVKRSLE